MTTTSTVHPPVSTVFVNEAPAYLSRAAAITKAVKDQLGFAQQQRNKLRSYVINMRTDGAGYKTRTADDTWEKTHQNLINDAQSSLTATALAVNLDRVDEVVTQISTFDPNVRTPAETLACRKATTRLLRAAHELHSVCEEHRMLTQFVTKVAAEGATFGIARPRHTSADWGTADNNLRNAAKKELRDSFDV